MRQEGFEVFFGSRLLPGVARAGAGLSKLGDKIAGQFAFALKIASDLTHQRAFKRWLFGKFWFDLLEQIF